MNKQFLEDSIFERRTLAGLEWLKKSIDVNDGNGSSAYYSQLFKPFKGWQLAYPETTGYIIDTFWKYHALYDQLKLDEYAIQSTDWICGLQLPSGALPGGYSDSKEPSVFNTGQMLIGLTSSYEHTGNTRYLEVIQSAVAWLLSILEEDGSWRKGAYVEGWVPSYYTRVVWAILWANEHLKDRQVESAMRNALQYYVQKVRKNQSVEDWAFKADQKAFTHTIAYTIRGFLESAILLNDQELLQTSVQLGEKIMRLRELNGKMAGWYDEKWKGDDWFVCLTGNAQLSIILSRMYQLTDDVRYLNTALKLFDDIVDKQHLSGNSNKNGALPGSAPFWGRYLIFRYPNWATKFYLDAYLLLKQETEKLVAKSLAT